GWKNDGMAVNMGHWAGTQTFLLCLALLSLQLFSCCCQSLQDPENVPHFVFTRSLYNATVYENSAARTYANSKVKMGITLVHRSWDIKYRIISGDEEGFFKAEEFVLGDFCFLRIRTKGGNSAILNREIQDSYMLTVKASVRGEDLETWTKVNIQVLDMNDLRPLFSPTTYSVTIPESTPLRTSVAQVTATDADIGSNGEFYYFFKEKVDLFAVHPTSGVVSLSGKLNIDEKNRYDLEILAVDRGMKLYGNNGVSSTAKLFIHIERVNEHAPTLSVVTHIPSLLDKDPTYAVVSVEDLDDGANGEIESVSIVAGDPLDQFRLVRGAGVNEYRIKASEPVDWDHFPYGYNLTLQAKDKGFPQKFSAVKVVHLYVNRPKPVEIKFEKEVYEVKLSEISPPGITVAVVKLSPEPEDVEYILSPDEDSKYFKINSLTGLITTALPVSNLNQELFELEVVELDSELRISVRVTIEDSNDHTPLFLQPSYEVFVNESIPIGTHILTVSATDNDRGENGYITYSIASLQTLPFTINQFTGVVSTNKELDFESLSESFVFVVRASDWGSPYRRESEVNVTVHLENVNDNHPLFEKIACQGIISYDFPIGEVITTMSAIDIDEIELVKYKILSGNERGFFDLNPDSGVLVLKRSLMTANPKNGVFNLKITATDGENFSDPMFVNISIVHGKMPSKSFTCKETRVAQKLAEKLLKKAKANSKTKTEDEFLDLFSVNRQTPQFDKSFPSEISVREDLEIGASVFRVKAYDGDTGFNGQVLYTISDGNKDSCFNIDMETGLITILMPMDREKTDRYLLNITIYDLGLPQKSTWRLLTVNVEDANDNTPQFLQESYNAVIPENTVIGTEVIQVEATDKDLGPNGDIYYTMLTSTTQFGINSTNGIVYVAGQLDREFLSVFNLKIEARDKAERGSQRFAVSTLRISLDDVNDCSPAFIPSYYNAKVLEDLPVGTVIAWLETQDPDLGLGGQVRYSLANDYNGKFEIDKASGVIRLAKELDYEKQQFYNLTVRAKDKGRPVSLLSVSFVDVEVVDVNENLYPPYFSDFALIGSVKENSRIGTSVLQVTARDDDIGRDGEIQYSIRDGSGLGRFSIDEETVESCGMESGLQMQGNISLSFFMLSSAIMCSAVHHYSTNLLQYTTSYKQNISKEQVIGLFHAEKKKKENTTFRPISNNCEFFVTPALGKKYREHRSTLYPKSFHHRDEKLIDVTIIVQVGWSSSIHYIMMHQRKDGRSCIIYTTDMLDRETKDSYWLTVYATDHGVVPLYTAIEIYIQVEDVNDNAPLTSEPIYYPSVMENSPKDVSVIQIIAQDPDSTSGDKLTYRISSGNPQNFFAINAKTGLITTTTRKLDREQQAEHVLEVTVMDGGPPSRHSTVWVMVNVLDENDNKPQFPEKVYQIKLPERDRKKRGDPIYRVFAYDRDEGPNADLSYSIVDGNEDGKFFIDPKTAVVSSRKQFTAGSYDILTIKALDNGRPQKSSTARLHIEWIKKPVPSPVPLVFDEPFYNFTVMEHDKVSEIVGVVSMQQPATPLWFDITGGKHSREMFYILQTACGRNCSTEGGNYDSIFDIEKGVGTIVIAKPLDAEHKSLYNMTVEVTDGTNAASTQVFVTVLDNNDNGPVFSQPSYDITILEDTPADTEVLQVIATDKDEKHKLSYSIHSSIDPASMRMFRIDPGTGTIYTTERLDHESRAQHILTVMEKVVVVYLHTCSHFTALLSDTIVLYTRSFPEDIPPNKVVLKIGATDADIGSNAEIQYSLHGTGAEDFFLDAETGELKTMSPVDREKTPVYKMTARATDGGGRYCKSDIFLTIEDVNDNPPVFSAKRYTASVYENTATKALLTRLQANDPDVGVNRKVVYSLVDSANGFFSIDKSSGIIVLEKTLDREQQGLYNITVRASDQGKSVQLSSLVNVTITVLDINDNPPVFERRDYLATVPEDVALGTEVLTVYAASKDIGTNAEIYYSIRSGNGHGKFQINSHTGTISLSKELDYETCKDYFLTVEARDGGTPPLSAVTSVNINLTDVNDNAPVFSRDTYSAVISEDASIGESVVKLMAEDMDSPVNGQILYSIVSGDRENQFFIDPITGLMKVNKHLDRETVSGYSLAVRALDSGSPAMSSTVMVNVDISDVNDNPPLFNPSNYTAVIQENKPIGTSILQLSVTDKDSSHNGPPYEFSIVSGNEGNEFALDQNGVLKSGIVFRREGTTDYVICVQAKDSGKPRLSSTSYVFIRVIEESIHKPVAIPLEIYIVTMEDEFPGGVIGKIHATDQDVYDVLSFSHRYQQKSLFKINQQDGKIIALGGLDTGKYLLNVTVSDGRFAVAVDVIVHVEQVTPEMLQNSVTIRFESVTPEDFIGLHMRNFKRTLRNVVASQKQDTLHILSIQPVAGTNQLDMLFAVQTLGGGFYKAAYLTQKLSTSRRHLENVLRISAILDKNCSGLECQEKLCEQTISLDSHALVTYSTARISFVSPRFHRNTRCTCNGGSCPGSSELCDDQPCPGDMQCVGGAVSRGPYICQCPPGKLGECAGHTSLSFAGNSYIKYRVSDGSKVDELRLGLRLRTLQSKGIIMYTRAEPCTILKIEDGKLWFQLDCGNSPGILVISGRPINDGNWHTVFLELNRNFTSLSLDDIYVERRRAPLHFQPLGPDGSIFFGAQVQPPNARSLTEKKSPLVLGGFQGCLDSVVLNNNELPLQNKRSHYAEVVGLTELKLGCVLYPDACERTPCQNSGSCASLPSGGFECICTSQFTGVRCETEITSCVPNPCQNGGSCKPIGNAFLCSCRRGFTGLTCEEDINECQREECENGGVCVNTFGAFYCNCTEGYVGQYCGLRPVVVPNIQAGHSYVGKEELIGIAVVLFVIFVLIILFIAFRKKVFRKNYSRNNITLVQDPATAALLNKANGIQFKSVRNNADPCNLYQEAGGPPQVPVRPMAYTPCFQSDSRGNLDKIVDSLGVEHTEMTTFHPESPRILTTRRGVVVCSVAPNLPSVSPCRSDCDSIRKTAWEADSDGKVVDMVEEVTCFSGSNKGSNSEVQSLSSFQSDSCDDNASIVTVIRLVNDAVDTIENEVSVMDQGQSYNRAYHWDTSDWMPSTRLPDIEEVPSYEAGENSSAHLGSTRELETDYYLGGYDIDSDYPPPQEEEFLSQDQLPPPLPEEYQEQYDTLPAPQPVSVESTLSTNSRQRPRFHPSQYLPPHQFPTELEAMGPQAGEEFSTFTIGHGQDLETDNMDNMSITMRLSANASSSDVSASCGFDDSEAAISDFESVDELNFDGVNHPFMETQQQTEV
ncbi:FAT3 protein, partial [Atractosteus spatula]|nr:FAT3 protein [Atractosteus spatula]